LHQATDALIVGKCGDVDLIEYFLLPAQGPIYGRLVDVVKGELRVRRPSKNHCHHDPQMTQAHATLQHHRQRQPTGARIGRISGQETGSAHLIRLRRSSLEDADAQTMGAPQAEGQRGIDGNSRDCAPGRTRRPRGSQPYSRAGVLEQAPEGGFVFPYDAIHVDFLLKAA
jgi:hypothetical protein